MTEVSDLILTGKPQPGGRGLNYRDVGKATQVVRGTSVCLFAFSCSSFDSEPEIFLWRIGKPYPHVRTSEKFLKAIKTKLMALTQRNLTLIAPGQIMGNVNRSPCGWVSYFRYWNSRQVMEKLKVHAEQRLCKQRHRRPPALSSGLD